MAKEVIVISLGGSLIVPDEVDSDFLKSFRTLILRHLKNKRFVLITGGGKTCRKYIESAKNIVDVSQEDQDWLGIEVTKLNAHLVKTIFKKEAYPKVINNPTEKVSFKHKVLVASGWKPGCSSDFDAVLLAKNFKVKKIVNLSNIDMVYDKDPRKFSDAKPLKKISWKDYRKIIPKKWTPDLSTPFDPIASKEAEKLKLEVVIMNGKKLGNLDNYLNNKSFVGTRIYSI